MFMAPSAAGIDPSGPDAVVGPATTFPPDAEVAADRRQAVRDLRVLAAPSRLAALEVAAVGGERLAVGVGAHLGIVQEEVRLDARIPDEEEEIGLGPGPEGGYPKGPRAP